MKDIKQDARDGTLRRHPRPYGPPNVDRVRLKRIKRMIAYWERREAKKPK